MTALRERRAAVRATVSADVAGVGLLVGVELEVFTGAPAVGLPAVVGPAARFKLVVLVGRLGVTVPTVAAVGSEGPDAAGRGVVAASATLFALPAAVLVAALVAVVAGADDFLPAGATFGAGVGAGAAAP